MRRSLVVTLGSLVALALLGSACAMVGFGSPSSALTNGAVAGAQAGLAAQPEVERCKRAASQPVVLKEERSVGGSLAVRFVADSGGLILKPRASASTESLTRPMDVVIPKGSNAELTRYVTTVGRLVAAQSARPELPWTFAVLDSDGVNAFSTPGGYVVISRGLLAHIENEAQLAAVLGHEIAHVTERHHLKIYQKTKLDLCDQIGRDRAMNAGASAAVGTAAPPGLMGAMRAMSPNGELDLDHLAGEALKSLVNGIADALSKGFPRQQELDADRIGDELAMRAGYRGASFIALLRRLPVGTGFFATHPPPGDRAAALSDWMKSDAVTKDFFEQQIISNATVEGPRPPEVVAEAR